MSKLYLGTREVTPAIVTGGSGGSYSEFPPYQVSNGVANRRSGTLTGNEFSNITTVGDYALYYTFIQHTGLTGILDLSSLTTVGDHSLYYSFYGCTGLTSVDLSSLTTVGDYGLCYTFHSCTGLTSALDLSSLTTVGSNGFSNAFRDCTGLTSVDLSSLTTVEDWGLYYSFHSCTGLTSVDLSSLTTVGDRGLYYTFRDCTGLTSALDLSSLTTVGSNGFSNAFSGCTALENIYFPALTTTSFGSYTNQFSNMLTNTGTTKTHTLHFPSNLQSTISGLTGYPTFGGTSGYVTLAFDLPATS